MTRQDWIDRNDAVALVQQCVLAGVSRATIHAQRKPKLVDESDLLLSGLIDEEYAPQEILLGTPGARSTVAGRWLFFSRCLGTSSIASGFNAWCGRWVWVVWRRARTPAAHTLSTRPIPTGYAAYR